MVRPPLDYQRILGNMQKPAFPSNLAAKMCYMGACSICKALHLPNMPLFHVSKRVILLVHFVAWLDPPMGQLRLAQAVKD